MSDRPIKRTLRGVAPAAARNRLQAAYVCIVRGVPSLGEVRSIYPAIGAEVPFVRLFDPAFSATVALARQRLVKAVSSTAGRYRGVAVG